MLEVDLHMRVSYHFCGIYISRIDSINYYKSGILIHDYYMEVLLHWDHRRHN